MDVILYVDNLNFSYGRQFSSALLFSNFFAQFAAGVTWVKGGNGHGKSTLLKLLAGVLPPSHGRIVLKGLDIDTDPMAYRRSMFWCGPGSLAFDHLTPLEYLGFMQGLYPSFDTEAVSKHVAGFALAPYLQTSLRSLSMGTQRKVWLAAALSAGTTVTLLDEPLNALDAASLQYLETNLAEVTQQADRAWIIVSHEAFGPASTNATTLVLEGASP